MLNDLNSIVGFVFSTFSDFFALYIGGAHTRQKDMMAQSEIVEEISNKEVLYSLGYWNTS